MNQEYLEFMASYLDKIYEAQNIDIEKIGYDNINKLETEIVDYARPELNKLDFIT